MALSPPLGPRPPSEALTPPPGKPDIAGCTGCPASGMEMIRSKRKLGLDSLDAPEHLWGGQRGTEPTAGPPRLSMPSSHEDSAEDKHHEHPVSGLEVLEAEQDSLHLCLLGLGLRLQDLERGLGPWTLAQSMTVRLQALQADLRGAAERVDALLAFGEGLAQRSEPRAWASLEQILRALGAHRDTIFRRLWQLQTQLVSYGLVFEEANMPDQDLEAKGDSDGPGSGGVWGPWAPSSLLTPAELEWDPAGDVGGLGPLRQRTTWTPGAPCELCGHRGPQGRGQGFEVRAIPRTGTTAWDTGKSRGASSSLGIQLLIQLLAVVHGKAVEDGPSAWAPAPMWESWKNLLALAWSSPNHCGHLGSETADGRSLSVSLSLSLSLSP
uniref:Spectrin repeat containing nuclear envelope family member 4 n=1 Tax=Oryctolagus cuniculus TaxID=9986 RepID=A0A5F9D1J1_RABIT